MAIIGDRKILALCGRDTSAKGARSPHPARICSATVAPMDTILLPREKSIKDGARQASRRQLGYSLAVLHGSCTLAPTEVTGLPQEDLGNGLMASAALLHLKHN